MRQNNDAPYAALLERIRNGCSDSSSDDVNRDFDSLMNRQLGVLYAKDPSLLKRFVDAPIIVTLRKVRDRVNAIRVASFAQRTQQEFAFYHSRDRRSGDDISVELQQRLWELPTSATEDCIGKLPLAIGIQVMFTENIAIGNKIVNGMRGILTDIKFDLDTNDRRFPIMAYVHVPDSNINASGLDRDIVPIHPKEKSFSYTVPHKSVPMFWCF
jgi:hypothetical protein